MTYLRKSTTVLYIAYIHFALFILPRDVLISFFSAHLTLPLTFLTFALGIKGYIENMKSRIHSSLVCWECINFHSYYFRFISVEIPTRCSFVIKFIIPKFFEGSTCFERHTAHHQGL
jgi:hypothetical protein